MLEEMKLRYKLLKPYYKHPLKSLALCRSDYNTRVLLRGSHVAVYPNLNICFNRIKKSGNTTVSAFLNDLSGGFQKASESGFKERLLTPREMTIEQLASLHCYYSFVVVRDPYSRTLSAFLDKVASGRSEKFAFCGGFGQNNAEGFSAYLDFLSGGGWRWDRHFWPQRDLLFQPVSHFNAIAKLESLVEDMREILAATGQFPTHADRLIKPHSVEAGTKKITDATKRLGHYYTDHSIALVSRIYASDFKLFGYVKTPHWI